MAHFVEQYSHAIKRADTYVMLTHELETCITNNVINHVSTDIKEAIDRLNVDSPFASFVEMMVWAATVSDHTETCLNLLRYFCNKVATQYDSLMFELDEYSLMIVAICADNKVFLKMVTPDRKAELAHTIIRWYLVWSKCDDQYVDTDNILRDSMDLILDGKTMQELDKYFEVRYQQIGLNDLGTAAAHNVNELIRPFQAIFINIVQNVDQETLLEQISFEQWRRRLDVVIMKKAEIYKNKFKLNVHKFFYETALNEFVCLFKRFNDNLSKVGYTSFVNPTVGEFVLSFIQCVRCAYDEGKTTGDSETNFPADKLVFIIRDAVEIFYNSFAYHEDTRRVIDSVVGTYCDSHRYEDALMGGEYLAAMRKHLDSDVSFDLWLLTNRGAGGPILDRVYAAYVDSYCNPLIKSMDEVIMPAPETAIEASSKINAEDAQESPEEDYESDIDARQSTKGYKRRSKAQAEAERKIYSAYKNYKDNESKVDSQLSKMLTSAKRAFSQDKTEEIIEGKRFTPISLLKKILTTAAIFNFSKIAGFIYLLTSHTISKKRTEKQRTEILIQIDTEISMLDEKIEDARGDGNRQAKYALMRTRAELIRARDKIKYNLSATKEDIRTAKAYLSGKRNDEREWR